MNRLAPHPWKVHSRSRYFSWRIHSGGSRVIRPRQTTRPAPSSSTVWIRPVQARRRTVWGWMAGPPSISHPPRSTDRLSTRAWTTTVARSGSGSEAIRAEHNATRASALRASAPQPSSSPGITGSCSARRSNVLATTPWAAGSSADSPNREFSAKYHQDTDRACSASRASWRDRPARSPWCLIAPQDTPWAQGMVGLGLGGGEPGQLHHLVDPHLPRGERLRDHGKPLQGVGRLDPPPGLPVRDAVAHPQPVGHVPGPFVPPGLPEVDLHDERKQLPLGQGDPAMAGVGRRDEFFVAALVLPGHPRPHRVTGGDCCKVYPNIRSTVNRGGARA